MVQIYRDGYCIIVKYNENLLKKLKDIRNLYVLYVFLFREKLKEFEIIQKILNVIKYLEMDSMVEMVFRNVEEVVLISFVIDDVVEVLFLIYSDVVLVEEEVISNISNDKIFSVLVLEVLEYLYLKE